MIQAKCIEKFRDNRGEIIGYRLLDNLGHKQNFFSDDLKAKIRNNEIHVTNLTLTSDNRLISTGNGIRGGWKTTKRVHRHQEIAKIIDRNLQSLNGNNGEYAKYKISDMKLYHGSRDGILGDIKPESRNSTDFGAGFYTGDKAEQALSIIRDNGSAKLFYTLCVDLVNNTNGRGKDLKAYRFTDDEIWALYIAYNRNRINNVESYSKLIPVIEEINKNDVIIGAIADDSLYSAFNEFFGGNITNIGLEYCISKVNLGTQYVFKSKKACSIIKYASIRPYNKLTDDALVTPLRAEINDSKEIVVEEAKTRFRNQGDYFEQVLERYK